MVDWLIELLILFSDNIFSCWCDQVFKLFSFRLIVLSHLVVINLLFVLFI